MKKKKKRATPHILSLLKNPPVNFSWLYLLRDLSVWFNVRLTVIGFWCLPLITSENWGGQFTLRMHIKRHQKLRSWRPGNIIKAFYNAAPCVIAYAVCARVCVCGREAGRRFKFYQYFLCLDWHIFGRAISNAPLFFLCSFTHSLTTGPLNDGSAAWMFVWFFFVVVFLFQLPLLMPRAHFCQVWILT